MAIMARVWKAGRGTLVTTVPKVVAEFLDIKENDVIEIDIKKVQKANQSPSGIKTSEVTKNE